VTGPEVESRTTRAPSSAAIAPWTVSIPPAQVAYAPTGAWQHGQFARLVREDVVDAFGECRIGGANFDGQRALTDRGHDDVGLERHRVGGAKSEPLQPRRG